GAAAVGMALLRQKGRVDSAAEQFGRVKIERLVQHDFGSRIAAATGRYRGEFSIRREQGPVVAVIIIDAGRLRGSARQLREQAGARIGGRGSPRVGIRDAAAGKLWQGRACSALQATRQVVLVEAVDTQEKYVPDVVIVIRVAYRCKQDLRSKCTGDRAG